MEKRRKGSFWFFFNAFLFFIEFKFCKRKRVLGNTLVIQGLGLQLSLPREDLDLIPGRELRSRRQCGEAKRNKTKRALEMVGGDGCTAIWKCLYHWTSHLILVKMEELSRMGTSDLQRQHPDKTGTRDIEHYLQRKTVHTQEMLQARSPAGIQGGNWERRNWSKLWRLSRSGLHGAGGIELREQVMN